MPMPSTMFDLSGKAAFIPGGYGGIGVAVAQALAEAGARVTVAGRDAGKAQALANQLKARSEMSREERAGARGKQSITRQSTRFFKYLGITLTVAGFGGLLMFQL